MFSLHDYDFEDTCTGVNGYAPFGGLAGWSTLRSRGTMGSQYRVS